MALLGGISYVVEIVFFKVHTDLRWRGSWEHHTYNKIQDSYNKICSMSLTIRYNEV